MHTQPPDSHFEAHGADRTARTSAGHGADRAFDVEALAAWIDDAQAPCPDWVIAAMAKDPALRSVVRDLRLGRWSSAADDDGSSALRARLIGLIHGPTVFARIGGWSLAAAAAIAVAVLGLYVGGTMAQSKSWNPSSDLAEVGLTSQADDDVLLAMLLPGEEDPS